jgi:MOSC domain-containing protein YiiM
MVACFLLGLKWSGPVCAVHVAWSAQAAKPACHKLKHYTARNLMPKMISDRAVGVLRVIHMGHHHVGDTERAAFQRTRAIAVARALELNTTQPDHSPSYSRERRINCSYSRAFLV